MFPAGNVQNILADLNSFLRFIDPPESGVLPFLPVSARCEVQQHTFQPETDSDSSSAMMLNAYLTHFSSHDIRQGA